MTELPMLTTHRSSTGLILGLILLTNLTGCSGCQQQTSVESTATEDPASSTSETLDKARESTAQAENAGEPTETAASQSASNQSAMKAKTAADSAHSPQGTQTTPDETANTPAGDAAATSPEQALTQAKELYQLAKSNNQAPGKAFSDATKAWELLNQYPDNAECQAMAAEISSTLGSMAAKANQKYHTELSGDPVLIEK
ncbi:hypothetical protein C5Y97_25270 [Blastopirellula marina]|uniref:Uncharacterized protein n=2 Tax=Blastopirellula marina TaxID=124 RepID=A0A2S8F7V3_9BACT|nr:hypothetical protein C5Y98_25255 [Blastopirellula marina]PTL41750.1 hypothetical protein C5Y97_25270 [Blastopirellula marina]